VDKDLNITAIFKRFWILTIAESSGGSTSGNQIRSVMDGTPITLEQIHTPAIFFKIGQVILNLPKTLLLLAQPLKFILSQTSQKIYLILIRIVYPTTTKSKFTKQILCLVIQMVMAFLTTWKLSII